jgi:hypothetical protein
VLELYGACIGGWNVKHFHEHLVRDHGFRWGYTWVKTQLHTAGLVERAQRRAAHRRKRERKPFEAMMLHQEEGVDRIVKAGLPQHLASRIIELAEPTVQRAAENNATAGRRHR